MNRERIVFASGVGVTAFVVLAGVVWAQTAPPITMPESQCYRHVLETNDRLCLARYNLPSETADLTPTPQWSQYGTEAVMARFMDDSTGAVFQERNPPSLDHALVGWYWAAGDTDIPTWADADAIARMQPDPSLFTTPTAVDSTPLWVATADVDETEDELCDGVRDLLRDIELDSADFEPDDLVSGANGTVTEQGTNMALGAFSGFVEALPDCFVVGAEGAGVPFNPTPGALAPTLAAQSQASETGAAIAGVAEAYLGMDSGNLFGALLFMGLALAGGGVITALLTGGAMQLAGALAGAVGLVFAYVGALVVGGTFLTYVLVGTTLIIIGGGMWLFGRVPR